MTRPPRLLAAALTAARRGWPVFPVVPGSKRPAIRGWPHRATCDPDLLTTWWRHAPYNIGIACGPAGLLVVDLDIPAGTDDGAQVLAALATEAGAVVAPTYTVRTPSGGQHRYYTVTPEQVARTTTGLLASQVDTRGTGGCVLAAGSVRRLRGGPGFYRVSHAGPAAPIPGWLAALLTRQPQPLPSGPQATVGRPAAYAAAAVIGQADRVRHAAVGTRHAVLFSAAARLGHLSARGMLPAGQAYDALRAAAHPHLGIAGFTPAEADRTIRNGLQHGQRRRG